MKVLNKCAPLNKKTQPTPNHMSIKSSKKPSDHRKCTFSKSWIIIYCFMWSCFNF